MVSGGERGQSTVEFALAIPLLLLVVLGLFDLARAVWWSNTLAEAAREGTRYVIVRGSGCPTSIREPECPATQTSVASYVSRYTIGIPSITATMTCGASQSPCPSPGPNAQQSVTVAVSADLVPIASKWFLGSTYKLTLRGSSTMVVLR